MMNDLPRPEYPRPQMVRGDWMNLNGMWEFSYDTPSFDRVIQVPYAYQARCSGIGETALHDTVWYRKRFLLASSMRDKRILLHFGAVDYACEVWLNGIQVAQHVGGHVSFEVEISGAVAWEVENELCVRVTDEMEDLEMPRGKQFWRETSHGIFYTRTTGIWQTVWLEAVEKSYIERIFLTPEYDEKAVRIEYELSLHEDADLHITVRKDGVIAAQAVACQCMSRGMITLALDQRRLRQWNFGDSLAWTPEHPNLFDVELELCPRIGAHDKVTSYFGMRKVSVENGVFRLNNRRYRQKMVLDQGYWPDSLMTAPTDADYITDIELCKKMGFNGVRKHQKIEDPRFLYHADRLGLLVWEEMPSAYVYSRLSAKRTLEEWRQAVLRDYNHPCIVVWTPLNESWGVENIRDNMCQQNHSAALVYLTKSLDATRPVVSNDGWEQTCTDLLTIHDYSASRAELESRYADRQTAVGAMPAKRSIMAEGWPDLGQPLLVTEYGGISYRKTRQEGWGYSEAKTDEEFARRYHDCTAPFLNAPLVQGICYTQLTDVEQEINGLLTPDRQPKIPIEIIRAINENTWNPVEEQERK